MFILFAPGQVPDRVLQAEIGIKIAQGAITAEDFPEAVQLFAQMAHHEPLIRREAMQQFGRPNWCCQLNVGSVAYGVWCAEDGCYASHGAPHMPSLVVSMEPEQALQILAGESVQPAPMYTGPRRDFLALRQVFARFLDQFLPVQNERTAKPAPESQLAFGVLGTDDSLRYFERSDELLSFAPPFDTLEALLQSSVDAVLASPTPDHTLAEIALRSAQAGKHVLCAGQVPSDDWQRLTLCCEQHEVMPTQHGVMFMAADLPRFLPAHNYMRKIVRAGLIGEVRTMRVLTSGSVPFAALSFILGCECEDVTAASSEQGSSVIARYTNGTLVNITVLPAAEFSMEIYGSLGMILENHAWEKPVRFYSSDPRMAEDLETWVEPYIQHTCPDWQTAAAWEAAASFARRILDEKKPDFTHEQTAHAIACAEAVQVSAEENRAVTISEMVPGYQTARRIQFLPPEFWQGYELQFHYESAHYYDTELVDCPDGFGVAFTKKEFDEPITKTFTDDLYQPCWEGAQAFGILEDGVLVACIELCLHVRTNRLRVTQMWTAQTHRRQGFGRALMNLAKERAQEQGCRALILETQSCNETAIAFYQAQGLTLFGFDRCDYSNQDIENREVRLELGLFF